MMETLDPPEYPDPNELPPASFVEDPEFSEALAELIPDSDLRDAASSNLVWTVNRSLVGSEAPPGLTGLGDEIRSQLIVTKKTAIARALRVVFSVNEDQHGRKIIFHAVDLADEDGSE